jgi:uncharacterized protein
MKLLTLLFSLKSIPFVWWSSQKPLNFRPSITTLVFLVLGLALFGLGDAIIISSNAGASPWTVLAQGISKTANWSIGFSTFVISLGVLIIWIPLKQKPGIGTILNVVVIAGVIDISLPYLPQPNSFALSLIQAAVGVIIIGLGSGFYLIANLGPGPRDGLMVGLQKLSDLPIVNVRTFIELFAVTSGWMMGGVVGFGTLIFVFGIGPAVALALYLVSVVFRK